ncbi:MAG: MCE family protein [Flavobacteriales bacterium]|nr:MCE family protein [Flavobacteriales bacterium]
MPTTKGDNIRLGLFVLAGTLLLIVGLYMLGSKQDLFRSTVEINARFHNAGGLRPGNNVRYAGINVGTVREVRIVSDTAVLVTMSIRSKEAVHIQDNAVASLGSDGLMGNKLVNIGPGEGLGAPIRDGVELAGSMPLDTDQMMRTLDRTNVNMAEITDDLRALTERLTQPGGVLHMLSDTLLAMDMRLAIVDLRRSVEHVRSATASVDIMLADVKAGRGALGMLVSDPATEAQVREGLAALQRMADTLAHASARLDQFAEGLNTPGGMGEVLTRDTTAGGDVRRTLTNLEKSSATLEENLRALQRNWFFRKYFREQEKEKAKELKRDGRTR